MWRKHACLLLVLLPFTLGQTGPVPGVGGVGCAETGPAPAARGSVTSPVGWYEIGVALGGFGTVEVYADETGAVTDLRANSRFTVVAANLSGAVNAEDVSVWGQISYLDPAEMSDNDPCPEVLTWSYEGTVRAPVLGMSFNYVSYTGAASGHILRHGCSMADCSPDDCNPAESIPLDQPVSLHRIVDLNQSKAVSLTDVLQTWPTSGPVVVVLRADATEQTR